MYAIPQGVICQINPVNPFVFDVPEGRRYPPIIFVHMAQRDPQKARMVSNALAILKSVGAAGPGRGEPSEGRRLRRVRPQRARRSGLPAAAKLNPKRALPLPAQQHKRRDTGVPGAEIQVDPRPLTPKLLQRAPQVSAKVAEAVVQALRKGGYLDEV